MITAQELFYKSQEQILTHRKSWEQIDEIRRFEYEAFAQWANELFTAKHAISFDRLCDQLAIERGLQIREYPTKWKDAKDIALRTDKDKFPEESAFELACRVFVELGGEMQKPFYDVLS